jgi:hypothetical protein
MRKPDDAWRVKSKCNRIAAMRHAETPDGFAGCATSCHSQDRSPSSEPVRSLQVIEF